MATPHAPRVFISATSGDLRSVRLTVKEALLKIGCMPIEQTDFPPDYRSVAGFLENEIKNCDAVIHIAGLRYGAEPNVSSLPPEAIRRSYTQLEYDIARKLKKKLYVFVCGNNFPYDDCDPEEADKVALQAAHRAIILSNSAKYEPVSQSQEINDKVRQLRVQLEELAKELHNQRRRSTIINGSVLVGLLLVLVVSIISWRNIQQTRRDVADASESLETVTQQSANILDAAKTTHRSLKEMDRSLKGLIDDDLFLQISTAADIDPIYLKQLVLQAQTSNTSLIEYADTLSEMKKYDAAYSLMRYSGESSLRLDPPAYLAAAEGFLLASEQLRRLALETADQEKCLKQLLTSSQLAMRGIEAHRVIPSSDSKNQVILLINLHDANLKANLQAANYSLPNEIVRFKDQPIRELMYEAPRIDILRQALGTSEPIVEVDDETKRVLTTLLASLTRVMVLDASFSNFDQAEAKFEQARNTGQRAMALLSGSPTYEGLSAAIALAEWHVYWNTIYGEPPGAERKLELIAFLSELEALYKGLEPGIKREERCELEILVKLLSHKESSANVQVVLTELDDLIERASEFPNLHRQLQMLLSRRLSIGSQLDDDSWFSYKDRVRKQTRIKYYDRVETLAYKHPLHTIDFAEFVQATTDPRPEVNSDHHDIVKAIMACQEIRKTWNRNVAPAWEVHVLVREIRLYILLSKVMRFSDNVTKEIGGKYGNLNHAIDLLDDLDTHWGKILPGCLQYLRARAGLEESMSRHGWSVEALRQSLEMFTEVDSLIDVGKFPNAWADVQLSFAWLSDSLARELNDQDEVDVEANRELLAMADAKLKLAADTLLFDDYPFKHLEILDEWADILSKRIVKSKSATIDKETVIRFSEISKECSSKLNSMDAKFNESIRVDYQDRFRRRVDEIKQKLTSEEVAWFDEIVDDK